MTKRRDNYGVTFRDNCPDCHCIVFLGPLYAEMNASPGSDEAPQITDGLLGQWSEYQPQEENNALWYHVWGRCTTTKCYFMISCMGRCTTTKYCFMVCMRCTTTTKCCVMVSCMGRCTTTKCCFMVSCMGEMYYY